jgi:hypothetical protein
MTATAVRRDTHWWATAAEPVQAVLDLANDLETDTLQRHADALLRLPGEQVREWLNLAGDLRMLDRLRSDVPSEVLSELYGQPWRGIYGDLVAEQEADDLEADVLCRAQLLASLVMAGAR